MRWAIETRSSQGAIPPTTSTPAASSEPVTGSPAPLERTPKEPLSIIEAYIVRFADNLEAGKVKLDDVAQFDKAVRLRAYLRGEGERDANKPQALTLDQLQGEHHARRAAERGADADDELAGVHAAGSDALEDDAPAPVQGAHVGTTTDSTRKRSSKGKKGKQKQEVAAALESKKPETKAPFSIDTNDEPDPLALDDEPVPPSQ